MTDWIQVLLGQPWEEPEGDGAEVLEQGTAGISVTGVAGVEAESGQAEESGSASEHRTAQPEEERDMLDQDGQAALKAGAGKRGEPPLRKTAASTEEEAPAGRPDGDSGEMSAGGRVKTLRQDAGLMWRKAQAETLEGTPARKQAELAAERIVRQTDGGDGYLEAALSVPPVRSDGAGRLMTVMSRNDRAAVYQTTVRQAEREESNAWTGTDPVRLDRFFERDARRYDNGFALY